MSDVLRDYQQGCHDSVLSFWGEEPWHTNEEVYRTLLVNMATSAGKTVTVGAIINSVRDRGKCLFLADTDELCEQPRKTFWRLFNMTSGLEKADKRASIMDDVVIASAQTLQRESRLHRYPPTHFSYIFVDEAHRGSDRNKKITDHFPAAKVMGMTATPFRAKLADLSSFYEHVAFELGVFDLINEGYIVPIKVLTLPVKVDISNVHQKKGDYDTEELDTTIRPYYEAICELILEYAEHRKIVAFLPLIKSSIEFVAIARLKGITARHVDGKSEDRKSLLAEFSRGDFQLLSNSSLLTTGWDCPPCDCLLNLAPTRSAGLFRQKVGRIGRILPGVIDGIRERDDRKAAIAQSHKPDSLILDCLWQTGTFDLQGPSDLIASNEREKKEIQQRLRLTGESSDLQQVTAEVQEAYEQRLKTELEEAAKRKAKFDAGRSKFNDAINYVAALLHGRKVTNYEPVMNWHRKPVSEGQKEWMQRQGFDPESALDRGHVSAFMNLILGRRKVGLCNYRVVAALEQAGHAGAISCRAYTAFELLGGDYPCDFGKKYLGIALKLIPSGYWEFCNKQSAEPGPRQGWFKRDFPIEWQWAQARLNPDGDCQCIGAHQAPNCPVHPRQEASTGFERAQAALDVATQPKELDDQPASNDAASPPRLSTSGPWPGDKADEQFWFGK